ncbi:MAG: hypothetical protein LR017_00830 [Candidatus Pacebacteria bacterium]|nr:hypothetical protein [Candidatus Paceibacterota bacterium]
MSVQDTAALFVWVVNARVNKEYPLGYSVHTLTLPIDSSEEDIQKGIVENPDQFLQKPEQKDTHSTMEYAAVVARRAMRECIRESAAHILYTSQIYYITTRVVDRSISFGSDINQELQVA